MRTRIFISLVVLTGLVLINSCKEDNVLTTDFSVTIKQDFTVNVIYDTVFVIDTVLDATTLSSDIAKYEDRIEELTLTRVTYKLTEFDGDSSHVLQEGIVGVAAPGDTIPTTLASMSNVNLQSLLNSEEELPMGQSAVTLVSGLVKNPPNQFRFIMQGSVNKKPVNFKVEFKFNFQIKAGIL